MGLRKHRVSSGVRPLIYEDTTDQHCLLESSNKSGAVQYCVQGLRAWLTPVAGVEGGKGGKGNHQIQFYSNIAEMFKL